MASSGGDENVSMKMFPDILGITELDTDLYMAARTWKGKQARGTFGGQTVGQALQAASQTVPSNVQLHSIHSYFLRPGDVNRPIIYKVSRTRDGNSFSSRTVSAIQKGKPILTLQASFHKEEAEIPSVFDYQLSMPIVTHHSQLQSVSDYFKAQSLTGRTGRISFLNQFPMEMKPLNMQTYTGESSDPDNKMTSWFRVHDTIGDDQNQHRIAAAFMSDWSLLWSSAVHEPKTRITMLASLDHTIWFHRPFKIDQWVLYEVRCENMANSRPLCQGRMWAESGELVATVMQEGILRGKL